VTFGLIVCGPEMSGFPPTPMIAGANPCAATVACDDEAAPSIANAAPTAIATRATAVLRARSFCFISSLSLDELSARSRPLWCGHILVQIS
jgi:hypothetical protein